METLLLFLIVTVCCWLLFPSCLLLVGRTLNNDHDINDIDNNDNENNDDDTNDNDNNDIDNENN